MGFQSYTGTHFAPWLLLIIPADATLSEQSTLTVNDLGKIPGFRTDAGEWFGHVGWTKHRMKDDREHQLKIFAKWDGWYPGGNPTIGINARLFPAVDIDIDNPFGEIVRDIAFDVFGPTIVRGRPNSKKMLLMYRLHQPCDFITKQRHVYSDPDGNEFAVEILGKGQQYLIEGRHPSGVDYAWVGHKTPLVVGTDELPMITPGQVFLFVQKVKEVFGFGDIKPVRPKGSGLSGSRGGGEERPIGPDHPDRAPSIEMVIDALGYLSATDPEFESRDDWEVFLRALKTAAGGDEDFYDDHYLPWNLKHPDNEEAYTRQQWDSHRTSQVGWSLVAALAGAKGYIGEVQRYFDDLGDDSDTQPDEPGVGQGPGRRHGPVPKPMPADFALHAMPRRPFVLGHRFMAGAVTLGVGAPGTGKSNLSILTALSIATGRSLTGEQVHKTGPVWIHNNEDSRDELYRRIGGMLQCLGIELGEVRQNILMSSGLDERLIVAFKSKDIVKRTEAVDEVIAAIKEQGIVHMVIDPLVSTHLGVSENSNEEIEQVIGTIQHIAHETGCSIDLVHHSLKSHSHNTEDIAGDMNAARGASSLIGAARMVYTLAPMSKKTAEDMNLDTARAARLVRLDHGKGNYAARDTNIRWFELEAYEIGNGDYFETDGPPVPGDTIAVPKLWDPPAKGEKASKAAQKAGKLQQVRDVVSGAMPANRCQLKTLIPVIKEKFGVKESAARALLKTAIPEGEEVTAEVAEQLYLLKLNREEPSPPGKLYVVRKGIFDQEAEAA